MRKRRVPGTMNVAQEERVWTEKEKEWKSRLEEDATYELITLEEAYESVPPIEADDLLRQKYGDLSLPVWCKLYFACFTLNPMRDVVVLAHSTLNCSACWSTFEAPLHAWWGCGFMHMPTTAIDKKQVIFGGEEELYEAIKRVDKDYNPKLIVIIIGCAPSIVQDDVPRVVERAQSEVGAKLFYIPTAGYEAIYHGQIADQISTAWVDLMDSPTKVEKDKVNILGNTKEPFWPYLTGERERRFPSDSEELARYIEGLGLKVHRVLFGGDYDYLRTAPEAGVNTVNCSTWGFPMAEAMKKRFGTPYVEHELPLGVEAAGAWIRDLAKLTGREEEAERLIKKEYEAMRDVWERCKEMAAGKVAISGGLMNRALSKLRLCQELGMEVIYLPASAEVGFGCDAEIRAKYYDTEYYLKYGFNPVVLRVREGVPRDPSQYRIPKFMSRLGLSNDDIIYLYPDWPGYCRAGTFDPSDVPHFHSSSQLRRMVGFPSRAVGFRGAAGSCIEIMEAMKASLRKGSSTFYGRLHGKPFESF